MPVSELTIPSSLEVDGQTYEIISKLGHGALGSSYLVRHADGLERVLKIFDAKYGETFKNRMHQFQDSRFISTDSVLGYTNVGFINDQPYIIHEYVPGTSFDNSAKQFKFDQKKPLVSIELGVKLCQAVSAIHSTELIHGHLWNGNVIFSNLGNPIIIDPFIGAPTPADLSSGVASISQLSLYLAPEQKDINGFIDPRTDIWHIGALLCRLYTGIPDLAVNQLCLRELYKANLPLSLIKVLWQAIHVSPHSRFSDVATFETALIEAFKPEHRKTVYVRPLPYAPGVKDGWSRPLRNSIIGVTAIVVTGLSLYKLEVGPFAKVQAAAPALPSRHAEEILGVSTVSYNSVNPDVAFNEAGDWVIVWEDEHQGSRRVLARGFDQDGKEQFPETVVNTPRAGIETAFHPKVAITSDGNFAVTWQQANTQILIRLFAPDGNPKGREDHVAAVKSPGSVLDPDVGIDNAGNTVVTWADDYDGNGYFQLYARGFNADCKERFGTKEVNIFSEWQQQKPSIAMSGSGDYVIAWEDDRKGTWDINARGFYANETERFKQIVVNSTTPGEQRNTAVAVNQSGGFAVVWEDRSNPKGPYVVKGKSFDSHGRQIVSERVVSSQPAGDRPHPVVALDGDGSWNVVWQHSGLRSQGNTYPTVVANGISTSGARTNVDDNRVTSITTSNEANDSAEINPDCSRLHSGRFIVAWAEDSDKNGRFQIKARVIQKRPHPVNDNTEPSPIVAVASNTPTAKQKATLQHIFSMTTLPTAQGWRWYGHNANADKASIINSGILQLRSSENQRVRWSRDKDVGQFIPQPDKGFTIEIAVRILSSSGPRGGIDLAAYSELLGNVSICIGHNRITMHDITFFLIADNLDNTSRFRTCRIAVEPDKTVSIFLDGKLIHQGKTSKSIDPMYPLEGPYIQWGQGAIADSATAEIKYVAYDLSGAYFP